MKIVILNDSFFAPAHLDRLRALGEVAVYDGTLTTKDAVERCLDAEVVLGDGFLVDFNKDFFEALPNLKLLALNTTAFRMVDLDAARAHNVSVAYCPGYATRSVAELIIGLMFASVRQISRGDRFYRANQVELEPTSEEGKAFIGYDLKGRTLGVVGVGAIGSEVAAIAQGIGMNVVGWNRTQKEGVPLVELEELVRTSDVIAITVSYAPETHGLLTPELLSLMKPSAVLISVAKRDVIAMDALYELLAERKIYGAAFDFAQCVENDPLLKLDSVVFAPHIGVYTEDALTERLPGRIVENVEAFVKGTPQNIV